MRKLTAADLMSKPVDTVEADTPLSEAVNELIQKDVSRLLVTEKGKPVGVISISDFVASIAREEDAKTRHRRGRHVRRDPGLPR